ncbi:hypothetical protein RRF57_009928 [Xylaria bambusicola]|uniref:Uncharacterized protein n=1 Tax=Xylaria bambusicola TaxID=326684 RepID=A0AAN7UKG3_9PEZI
MKFAAAGSNPNSLRTPGIEKSFISLLRIIPVDGTICRFPNNRLTVVVLDTAMPDPSAVVMCEVPSPGVVYIFPGA